MVASSHSGEFPLLNLPNSAWCCGSPFTQSDSQSDCSVELYAPSLLVAQAHVHQSTSEVMGLLGGHHQEGHLRVVTALPTKAVASGQECDMDPGGYSFRGVVVNCRAHTGKCSDLNY